MFWTPWAPPKVGESQSEREQDTDDLPEAQRDDGQVVAAHPDHRSTDQQPRDRRHDDRHGQRSPPGPLEGEAGRDGRGQHADGIGPHGEEGHVPQVEHPGQAHHDVEAEAHQQEQSHVGEHLREQAAEELG